MKSFVLKLTLFIVIIAGLDYVTGIVMDSIYAGTIKGDYGRNNYIANDVHAECLIFGSSRAIHHYNPDKIGKALGMSCYNCGEDGMGIITMYGRFKEIIERYTPQVIIYDVQSSFDLEDNEYENSRYIGFLRFNINNTAVAEIINSIDPTEKYKNWSKSYKYNSRFADIVSQYVSKDPLTAADYTYGPTQGEIDYEIKKSYNTSSSKWVPKIDSLKLSMMQQMIDECKTYGINLYFIISPVYLGQDSNRDSVISNLCRHNKISLLNHVADARFVNNPHLFHDSAHLNQQGAELYSEVVAEEMRNLYVQ